MWSNCALQNQYKKFALSTACSTQFLWLQSSMTIPLLFALQRFARYPQGIPAAQLSFPNQPGQYYLVPLLGQYPWLLFCLLRPPLHMTHTYLLQEQCGGGRYVMIGTAIALGCVGLGYVIGSTKGGSRAIGSIVSVFSRNFGVWFWLKKYTAQRSLVL